jgi:hypothetical protein
MKLLDNITIDELRAFIVKVFHEEQQIIAPQSSRSLSDIFASIDQLMWTPPEGAKTGLEMIREDRDS